MSKMKRLLPRFSLRSLLILFAAVALFFGVAAIRRQRIQGQIEQFKSEGVNFKLDEGWTNKVWIHKPEVAEIAIAPLPLGQFQLGAKKLWPDEVATQVELLGERLIAWGVKATQLTIRSNGSGRTVSGHGAKEFKQLQEFVSQFPFARPYWKKR